LRRKHHTAVGARDRREREARASGTHGTSFSINSRQLLVGFKNLASPQWKSKNSRVAPMRLATAILRITRPDRDYLVAGEKSFPYVYGHGLIGSG